MNRKLVLIPTVLATAVMVGCNSDSGGPSGPGESEPHLINLLVESTNATKFGNQYRLPAAYPIQFTATAVYSDQSTKTVTNEAVWEATDQLSSKEYFLEQGEFFALSDTGEPEIVTVSFGGEVVDVLVDVQATQLDNIEAKGPQITLVGLSSPYQAIANFDNDLTLDISSFVGWESDLGAKFTRDGFAEFPEVGFDTISAEYLETGNFIEPFKVEIVEGTADEHIHLAISGAHSLTVGSGTQLTAMLTLDNGAVNASLDVSETATWNSSCKEIEIKSGGYAVATAEVVGCDVFATYDAGDTEIVNSIPHTMSASEAVDQGLLVSCEPEIFYNETKCTAHTVDASGEPLDNVSRAGSTSWALGNNEDFGTQLPYGEEFILVKSTTVGAQSSVTAHYGLTSDSVDVSVGFVSDNLEIENTDIYVGGSTQLKATTDGVNITDLVTWELDGVDDADWTITKGGLVTVSADAQIGISTAKVIATWDEFEVQVEQLMNVVPLQHCDSEDLSGSCLGTEVVGALTFSSGPSKALVETLNYVKSDDKSGEGRNYHQIDTRMEPFNAARLNLLDSQFGNQHERWCRDLNVMEFDGKTDWQAPTVEQLQSLAKNVDIEAAGWPIAQGYWAHHESSAEGEPMRVSLTSGAANSDSKQNAHFVSCVSGS